MDKATVPSASKVPHLASFSPHPSSDTFQRFPDFPTEVRLLIWRAAILIDFRTSPITVKPYSHAYRRFRRVPPKTSCINRESRDVTLKHFRCMELQRSDICGCNCERHKKLRRIPPIHCVLWDKETDVLMLDWWCVVANVNNVVSYLSLKPFLDEDTESISCVQILEIDTEVRGVLLGPQLSANIQKILQYFVRLREVRFLNWALHRSFYEERQLVGAFEDCFNKLAKQNKGYCVPRICVMLRVD